MKIYETAGGWWVEPETTEDQLTSDIQSLSGPWGTKEAANLAAQGKFRLAHAAEKVG